MLAEKTIRTNGLAILPYLAVLGIFFLHFYPFNFSVFKFIRYDDEMFIRPMLNVGLADYFTEWFPSPYNYGFPVRDLTFFFDEWLSSHLGFQTYHYTNFVFFAGIVLLFNRLLLQIFPGQHILAFFLLLIAFLHPLNVEIVQWISARKNLLPVLFVMMGNVLVFPSLLAGTPLRRSHWAAVFGLQAASLACYPSSTLWLPWLLCVQQRSFSRKYFYGFFSFVIAMTIAYVHYSARGDSDFGLGWTVFMEDLNRVLYFLPRSLGRGFYNFVMPTHLSMFYDPDSILNFIGLGLLCVTILGLGYLINKVPEANNKRCLLILGSLIICLLAPQGHVILSFSDFRWADRYCFIALPYVIAFLALLAQSHFPQGSPLKNKSPLLPILGLLLGGGLLWYGKLSRDRIPLWRNEMLLQEECARVEGAPKCVVAMMSSYFTKDCSVARTYINQGYQRYVQAKPAYDGQFLAELPFYDATCTALSASLPPQDKLLRLESTFDKYPGSPGPVFAMVLAYLEAGNVNRAWEMAHSYYLSGRPEALGATKLQLQIYLAHTKTLCGIVGTEECWRNREILIDSNKRIPQESPIGSWASQITTLMSTRSRQTP